MEQQHRDAIQNNYISLVERTDLESVVTRLYERNIFSSEMIERYRDTTISERDRKRKLYRDITRRGPEAYGHLLEVLSEVGNWDLVRMLDPTSDYHTTKREYPPRVPDDNNYVSLSDQKKARNEMQKRNSTQRPAQAPAQAPPRSSPPPDLPVSQTEYVSKFEVIKSATPIEEDKDVESYPMLDNRRRYLLIFSYTTFDNNLETSRAGVDADNANLKHVFSQMDFKVLVHQDLTRDQTLALLRSLKELLADAGLVFVVVSSHGYQTGGSDISVRCKDNVFISTYEIVKYFSNYNLPHLIGVPKVFIFQTCRGSLEDYTGPKGIAPAHMPMPSNVTHDGTPVPPAAHAQPAALATDQERPDYSDILIAHSTVPGYVSYRDTLHGSWFVQVVCELFAERAHDCDVDKLFTLVDNCLQKRFHKQVSSIDRWGFNKRLRLYPGRR